MTALKNEGNNIQKTLNKKLQMKIVPRVVFKLDETEAQADEIERLLRQIESE